MANPYTRSMALSELYTEIENIKKVWDDIYSQVANNPSLTIGQIIEQTNLVKSMIDGAREGLDFLTHVSRG